MPPFSGKKKKEQLKERRARKRNEAERQQCEDAALENNGETDHQASLVAKTMHAHMKGDPTPAHESRHTVQYRLGTHDSDKSSSANGEVDCATRLEFEKGTYKYGADRRGIRSVFKKETKEEIEARRQVNYAPIPQDNLMTSTGIPFSDWFLTPGNGALSSSRSFPFSLELPSRGWNVNNSNPFSFPTNPDKDIEHFEAERFSAYLQKVDTYQLPIALQSLHINIFERNLDVWRQLWRTVESSDVVIVVVDSRYPLVHLPLALLHYILKQEHKPCVILLNKSDLVPKSTLEKWMRFIPLYLQRVGLLNGDANRVACGEGDSPTHTEGSTGSTGSAPTVLVRPFTTFPLESTASGSFGAVDTTMRRAKKKRRARMYEQLRTGKLDVASELKRGGASQMGVSASDSSSDEAVDGWTCYASTENFLGKQKAQNDLLHDKRDHKELQVVSDMISELLALCRLLAARVTAAPVLLEHGGDNPAQGHLSLAPADASGNAHEKTMVDGFDSKPRGKGPITTIVECEKGGNSSQVVHIGVVGHPNVGKSSLLNCIRGTKVVSVSATPGHTKHIQTIPIPSEGVTLVDSPGIAFPVFGLPRPLQAVVGTHQIAQTRDPQSGVAYLAMHLPLQKLYGLRKPEGACDEKKWCPYDLCEAYAIKKGYRVKHGKGAADVHRAAIAMLQEAYEGRLVLFFAPPEESLLQSKDFEADMLPYLRLPVLQGD